MNLVAAVFADFAETFLGGESQLLTPLGSRTVLGHTLQRLARVAGLDHRCLFVRPRAEDAARTAVRELGLDGRVDVLALDDGTRPRRGLIRSGRKWNLGGWRGSPLGTTWFDEYVEPLNVARVLDHYRSDGVLCLDGHQAALDVSIASALVTYQRANEAEAGFVFTQAPPGIAGIILRREVTRDLLEQQYPVGLLLSYRPEIPQSDLITKPPCLRIPSEIAQTQTRLSADTRRSRELLAEGFAELGEDCDAQNLCARLGSADPARLEPLPAEIELELTTDDPLPDTTLRPRGERVPHRYLSDPGAVAELARRLATYDDRLLVLGGHGDPLLYPGFPEVCRLARTSGVCGLGVITTLVELSDAAFQALFDWAVDLVEVRLDANSAATYHAVHGADRFARVVSNIDKLLTARRERRSPQPLVVCSLTRCAATLPELEAFFERWIRAAGWAVIHGYNDFGGLLPPDSLQHATPPVRGPCRRLRTRMTLLADGSAVLCSQDVRGETAFGSWSSSELTELWRGAALQRVRDAHLRMTLDEHPRCAACREWFRP